MFGRASSTRATCPRMSLTARPKRERCGATAACPGTANHLVPPQIKCNICSAQQHICSPTYTQQRSRLTQASRLHKCRKHTWDCVSVNQLHRLRPKALSGGTIEKRRKKSTACAGQTIPRLPTQEIQMMIVDNCFFPFF